MIPVATAKNQMELSCGLNDASICALTVRESISAAENLTETHSRYRITKNTQFALIFFFNAFVVLLFLASKDLIVPTHKSLDFINFEYEQRQLRQLVSVSPDPSTDVPLVQILITCCGAATAVLFCVCFTIYIYCPFCGSGSSTCLF